MSSMIKRYRDVIRLPQQGKLTFLLEDTAFLPYLHSLSSSPIPPLSQQHRRWEVVLFIVLFNLSVWRWAIARGLSWLLLTCGDQEGST